MILLVLLTGLDSVINNSLLNVSYLGRQDPTDVLLLLGLDTMRKRSRDSVRNGRCWAWGHKTEEKPGFRPVWGSGSVGQASARQDLILGSTAWHLGLVEHTLCTKRAASWLPLT